MAIEKRLVLRMEISNTTKNAITAGLSRRISVFGFFCALLIVLLHSTPRPTYGTWEWWVASFLGRDGLCRIAVPFFFLASGFLLAGHVCDQGWWWRELNKRVKTLIVPYFVWIVIGFLFNSILWYAIGLYGHKCDFQSPFYRPVSLWLTNIVGANPFSNSVGILWYVRSLFLLVIASKILVLALRCMGWVFVIVLFAAYGIFAVSFTGGATDIVTCFEYFLTLRGLCYFTIGIALRYCRFGFMLECSRTVSFVLLIVGVGLLFLKVIFLREVALKAAAVTDIIMVPMLCAGFFITARNICLPRWLVDNAFAIYLIHMKVLLLTMPVIVIAGIKEKLGVSVALWIARFAVAASISLFTAVLLKKYVPRCSSVLFGGR